MLTVYDAGTTNRNVFVSPELRARLYHMKPGQVDARHSHDLGHEVFLVLEGRAAFDVEGETREMGPGQLCVVRANEIHQVRNVADGERTVMFLSVTPHVQPTHTGRPDGRQAAPPAFRPNTAYDDPDPAGVTIADLLASHRAALDAVAAAASAAQQSQERLLEALAEAFAADETAGTNDDDGAGQRQGAAERGSSAAGRGNSEPAAYQAKVAVWETLKPLLESVAALEAVWNRVAGRGL